MIALFRVEWVIRESEICLGHQNQWVMLLKHSHASTGIPVSKVYSLVTRLAACTVSVERSERPLKITWETVLLGALRTKLHHAIPVNHREASPKVAMPRISRVGLDTRTINSSRKLWGGGSVLSTRKRDLEVVGRKSNRPYSTKTLPETPSWKDSKAVKRLESLWRANERDPNIINERLFPLLKELEL